MLTLHLKNHNNCVIVTLQVQVYTNVLYINITTTFCKTGKDAFKSDIK